MGRRSPFKSGHTSGFIHLLVHSHLSSLHQRIIKLSPVQPLLMVRPRWCWHAAVRIQQDTDAANHEKEEQQHEEADKTQRRALFWVTHHGLQHGRAPGEPRRRRRGELIVHNPVVCVTHLWREEEEECFWRLRDFSCAVRSNEECYGFAKSSSLLRVKSKPRGGSHSEIWQLIKLDCSVSHKPQSKQKKKNTEQISSAN